MTTRVQTKTSSMGNSGENTDRFQNISVGNINPTKLMSKLRVKYPEPSMFQVNVCMANALVNHC